MNEIKFLFTYIKRIYSYTSKHTCLGLLYSCCRTNGYNKLVLAQHLDDLVESFLMSALHNGQVLICIYICIYVYVHTCIYIYGCMYVFICINNLFLFKHLNDLIERFLMSTLHNGQVMYLYMYLFMYV
jgi:hypothetical protein